MDEMLAAIKAGFDAAGVEHGHIHSIGELKNAVEPRKEIDPGAECEDMDIVVTAKGGKYDGKELRFSAWLVKSIAEKHEKRLPDEVDEEGNAILKADPQFAIDLSKDLEDHGMECTPVIAVTVWVRASAFLQEVQKKTKDMQTSASGTESTPTS